MAALSTADGAALLAMVGTTTPSSASAARVTVKNGQLMFEAHARQVPLSVVDVVIVAAQPTMSRRYWPDGRQRPLCVSPDGVSPVGRAEAAFCQTCPQNVVGSAFSRNRKPVRACGYFWRVALVALNDLTTVYSMDIGASSIFGRDTHPTDGAGFQTYTRDLTSRRVALGRVVTRMTMQDNGYAVRFRTSGFLTPEQRVLVDKIVPVAESRIQVTPATPATPAAPVAGIDPQQGELIAMLPPDIGHIIQTVQSAQ